MMGDMADDLIYGIIDRYDEAWICELEGQIDKHLKSLVYVEGTVMRVTEKAVQLFCDLGIEWFPFSRMVGIEGHIDGELRVGSKIKFQIDKWVLGQKKASNTNPEWCVKDEPCREQGRWGGLCGEATCANGEHFDAAPKTHSEKEKA
jgi:hypothetical protein